MDFENWWLLAIPVIFGLGWVAARIDLKQVVSESRTLPRGYFKGLKFLLNDDPDKAIDVFIDVLKLDTDTIDLYFVLGTLFRKRGETERAIRIHKSLLDRVDLFDETRAHATYELGLDYLKAGLLDRAEETFHLLMDTHYSAEAGRALLEIYQREKEWERAIKAAETLQASGAGDRHKEIAEFYCELAEDELVRGKPDAALTLLDKALSANRNCVRATMLMGDAYLAKEDVQTALETWRRVEQQSMQHVSLVAKRLLDGYHTIGQDEAGISLLRSYLAQQPSIDMLEVVFEGVLNLEGTEAADQLVTDELRRTPTLLALDKYLEARLINAPRTARADLSVAKNLIHSYTQKLARYQCSHCGFKAKQFYWYCPGCNQWETYPPRRAEELNVMR